MDLENYNLTSGQSESPEIAATKKKLEDFVAQKKREAEGAKTGEEIDAIYAEITEEVGKFKKVKEEFEKRKDQIDVESEISSPAPELSKPPIGEGRGFLDKNGKVVHSTGEQEKYGLRVGQVFRYKPAVYCGVEPEFTVVGFSRRGMIMTQNRSGDIEFTNKDRLQNEFEDIDADPGLSKTLTTIDGFDFRTTGEQEKYGLKVGQAIKLQNIMQTTHPKLKSAQQLTIAGFLAFGDILIQLDGGLAWRESPQSFNINFRVVR